MTNNNFFKSGLGLILFHFGFLIVFFLLKVVIDNRLTNLCLIALIASAPAFWLIALILGIINYRLKYSKICIFISIFLFVILGTLFITGHNLLNLYHDDQIRESKENKEKRK